MALTLGTTGMDRKTEAEVQAAFKVANAETGHHWTLVDGDSADYVLIDMDSLYGPMSWLRLHSLGRKVIGLSSADRQQTDYRLPHPINANDLVVLLSEIAGDIPLQPVPLAEPASTAPAAAPVSASPGPTIAAPVATPAADPVPEPAPIFAPEPEPAPPAPPLVRTLHHWLNIHSLPKRVRLQRDGHPPLLIDVGKAIWHGSATLKPLIACFEGELSEADFSLPDNAAWDAEAAKLGAAQPLLRLQWLGGLLSGAAIDGKYILKKWPQTEREYPKHFRIATVMMKGPASVEDVATASGVSVEEVIAFINANLATGYAELAHDASPPPATPSKPTGLFGRMRGH
ncbi:MAG TPA: hypothetical protein PK789_01815 [Thermomonas sp.]|jgi:hypothetical protein|uniref:hypothetical protein n=1 Tax=Thermomonas sp. TaxID=1971895 RepID=UPI002C3EBDD3|nr:hypothetical protein [Thermomonas sp.]HOV95501.1 hypothetical protein [Thermomonas sp.]